MTDYKNFHDCKVSKDDMSNDFDILVNGKNINATSVRVSAMPFNRYWPGQQRPLNQTEKASYIYISSNEFPLEFTLTPKKEFKEETKRAETEEFDKSKEQFEIAKRQYQKARKRKGKKNQVREC